MTWVLLAVLFLAVAIYLGRAGDAAEMPNPTLPVVMLVANGAFLLARPAAYFSWAAPRWMFKDGRRGEPSQDLVGAVRLYGVAVLVLAAVWMVAYLR